MSFQIYHQLGFRYNWNFDSLAEDNTGDGVILAPRYMDRRKVEDLGEDCKKHAIFDPQFFLPNVPRGSLSSYDFFPEVVSEGYDTDSFGDDNAKLCAEKCLEFQNSNNFKYLVIPTRRVEGMPSNYIEKQNIHFIKPFVDLLKDKKYDQQVLLQLILNNNMIKDDEYIRDILNWITGIQNINGIYLITETSFTSKQIKDNDYLYCLLKLISELKENELDVVLGYLNTEAILLSVASPDIVAVGAYENLRRFNLRAFSELEDGTQRGPKARLYFSKLLQWIDHDYLNALKRRLPNFSELLDHNQYRIEMFEPEFNWHFTKPQIYKHHFLEFSKQLRYISEVEGKERFELVHKLFNVAIENHQLIADAGIVLSPDDDGSHLFKWQTALNEFAGDMGWR